ncbi:MAG: tetratricopeptide repeat protein [Betaproteobacteria bacterium]|nr:tetratricopeptide repeat protein [Betaproteobacteria bacterium]
MLKNLIQALLSRAGGRDCAPAVAAAAPDRLHFCITQAAGRAAAGDHAAAADLYRESLEQKPQDPRIWCNFGAELDAIGQAEEAELAYRRALELDPALAQAWYNLGQLQQERGREGEAETCYRSALALLDGVRDHELWQLAYNNWGLLLQRQGRLEDAVKLYREALAAVPADASLRSNLLFLLTAMADVDPDELLKEHRAWGKLHVRAHAAHANLPDPERRIRIGYVSADFYSHPLAFFVLPLLANRDRARTEAVCYCNGVTQDRITARLRQSADRWRDIRRLGDADADALIRADGIDILVDLSGHTAGNRLPLFGGKPAPVQVTFLGYANTTGLDTVDYRITDGYADPPGTEARYAEKLLRMPHSLWCYEPQRAVPPANPAPVLENGYVTFASFNGAYKLNQPLMKVWAAILHAVPDSRLMLVNLPTGGARERIVAWLGAQGIGSGRLELHARLPTDEFWAAHRRADIALDPFPCNGGATTCETLWLGVPVITLAGQTFVARAGLSLLSNCGLTQLIAGSPEEYVVLAAGLAREPLRLADMRVRLKESLPGSPLLDAPAYTQALEAQYRAIWRQWCSQQGRGHA